MKAGDKFQAVMPVNLTLLLQGLLAAEITADDIQHTEPLIVQVAMLRGAVHAACKIMLDAEVTWDAFVVAANRNQIVDTLRDAA